MKNKIENKKKTDSVVLLLDLAIFLMTIVLVGVGLTLRDTKNRADKFSTFTQDANRLKFELENNDFEGLISGKYSNEIFGDNDADSLHAVADYIEAVSKYKIFVGKGYGVAAQEQQILMDTARERMGVLKIYADRIDGMFGVE